MGIWAMLASYLDWMVTPCPSFMTSLTLVAVQVDCFSLQRRVNELLSLISRIVCQQINLMELTQCFNEQMNIVEHLAKAEEKQAGFIKDREQRIEILEKSNQEMATWIQELVDRIKSLEEENLRNKADSSIQEQEK